MVEAIAASPKRKEDQRYLSGSNIFEAIRVDTKLVLGPGAGPWCWVLVHGAYFHRQRAPRICPPTRDGVLHLDGSTRSGRVDGSCANVLGRAWLSCLVSSFCRLVRTRMRGDGRDRETQNQWRQPASA